MSTTVERERRIVDTLGQRARRPDRSPGVVVVDRIWRFFCSVRVALYEIVLLAVLVLIGTLKNSIIPAQIPRFIPALTPLVKRWYQFDVFHSLIFALLLGLLAVAIVICTINRLPGIWDSITRPTILTTRQFFQVAEPAVTLTAPGPTTAVAADLVQVLKTRRYRVLTAQQGNDVHVYADKFRFGKLGTFPFHLALILVLVGGIVGAQLGFRDKTFAIPAGSTRAVGHGTGLSVRLNEFVDDYNQLAQPTAYRSDLTLYKNGHEVRRQTITVNHPLSYWGTTFYQASFGQAAVMRVTDTHGAVVFDDGVAFMQVSRTNPDAPAATFDLPARDIRFELVFPNLKLNAKPEVGNVKLMPGELYAQALDLQTNQVLGGTIIGQGQTARLAGLNVQFVREARFTLLQVASNPGIPLLFVAALLLVFGLIVTFAFPHRRVRALVSAGPGGTEVLLAPLARRDWDGQRDFARTLTAIEGSFGAVQPYGRMVHGK